VTGQKRESTKGVGVDYVGCFGLVVWSALILLPVSQVSPSQGGCALILYSADMWLLDSDTPLGSKLFLILRSQYV
jgi:hypothetical protein